MARPANKRRPAVHSKPVGTLDSGKRDVDASPDNEARRAARDGDRRDIEVREDLAAGGTPPATTQVADGLLRRAWTVYEVERMVEVGILREPEPFELIGGELVAMAPKDRRHEVLRTELVLYWADRRRGRDLKVATETPLRRPRG